MSLLALALAVVAVVAGVRLLLAGDWLWGGLAMVPALALTVATVTFAFMVFSIQSSRRGDLIPLDPGRSMKFAEAVAQVRQQLSVEAARVDQQAAAVRLWELAWDLHQSPPLDEHSQPWSR